MQRLKQLARNVKMPGFRPGKVPMKLVAQTYGPQVRNEVLGDAVQKSFTDAVKEANLRVAGYPKIEPKTEKAADGALEFSATFEVYPEVKVGDLSAPTSSSPRSAWTMRRWAKRSRCCASSAPGFVPAQRPARDGDRVTVDFQGTIDGAPFEGGKAENFVLSLGEGRMLPEFETAARGMSPGRIEELQPEVPRRTITARRSPGKEAQFRIAVKKLEEPQLPEIDAEFAKSLGVADGDVDKMRAEVRANVEREVKKRVDARVKNQVMEALLAAAPIELPKSLVEMEAQSLVQRAAQDLAGARRQAGTDQSFAAAICRYGEAARGAGPDHCRARARRKPAAQARGGARARGAGGAELRESRRGSKMVLHAAPAAVGDGSDGAGSQCCQMGFVESESARERDRIRRADGSELVNWEKNDKRTFGASG